jgi:hypothetical protein
MSINMIEPTMEQEKTTTTHSVEPSETARSLFTHQTGQALVALGTMFKHIPPFNEAIDTTTSNTLISIGKKLKNTK